MLTLEQSKKYHELARIIWRRDELRLPASERVDSMGDRGLAAVLNYQRQAKNILEATGWRMPENLNPFLTA